MNYFMPFYLQGSYDRWIAGMSHFERIVQRVKEASQDFGVPVRTVEAYELKPLDRRLYGALSLSGEA